jgi:hypothetical protein
VTDGIERATSRRESQRDRRTAVVALLCCLAPALDACPQSATAVDGPAGRFDDDLISRLEGTWRIRREIRGTQVENRATCAWVLNHQFLQLHMKDAATPPRYEAIVLIGYVYAEKQYVAHWTDTFGAKFSSVGRGLRSGNSIEFRFEYPDGPFFNTFTWHPERSEWVCRLENQAPSGDRQLFATDTWTVAK